MFKKLINWFLSLFRSKYKPSIPLAKRKVAIVIGHNSEEQGAVNYLGESEWSFNGRIASKLEKELNGMGIPAQKLYRVPGIPYKDQVETISQIVNEIDAQIVVSLHFNAFSSPINGCECMHSPGLQNQNLALSIASQLKVRMEIPPRRFNGAYPVSEGHSGYYMLKKLSKKNRSVCIVEPCFGNTKNFASIKVFTNENLYVMCLAKGIRSHLKSIDKL